jgi:isoleucyl-tRNA synthetase
VLGELKGADLAGTKYQHPFYERQSEIVIGGDYITTESGRVVWCGVV